jgi:hypothetical protein
MSMIYIRKAYGVPAKRGGRVRYRGREGTITSACGPHLRVRFDGDKRTSILHPTWSVDYLENDCG